MKGKHYTLFVLSAAALAACKSMETAPPPPAPAASTSPAASPAAPAVAKPPPQAATLPPPPAESKPTSLVKEMEDEAQRLLSMQKSYFNVFKIDEASSGLKPRPNAVGVFDLQNLPRSDRLRLTIAQQPKKPARLSLGSYTVVLDTVADYVEVQVCQAASCAGKRQRIVRQLPKVIQFQLSPLNQYFGSKDISLAEPANAEGKDRNYKSMFQNVVITVKHITVTPILPSSA